MMAAHYRLDNLVAIVDRNGLQITGSTEDVCQLAPLDEKFEAFGFAVQRCDGNNMGSWSAPLKRYPSDQASRAWYWPKPAKAKGSVSWRTWPSGTMGCPMMMNLAGQWLNWRRRKPHWLNGTSNS